MTPLRTRSPGPRQQKPRPMKPWRLFWRNGGRKCWDIERVGLDDDFFELGGQSLHVVRLFAKIKKTYSIDFDLSTFFEARTIRKLARLVREAARPKTIPDHSSGRMVVPIQASGTQSPLYVVSGLDGHVLAFRSWPSISERINPCYGLVPRGLNGHEPYHTRVEDMAAHYARRDPELHSQRVRYRLAGSLIRWNRRIRGCAAAHSSRDRCELSRAVGYGRAAIQQTRLEVAPISPSPCCLRNRIQDGRARRRPVWTSARRLARRISGKISSILHAAGSPASTARRNNQGCEFECCCELQAQGVSSPR